MYYDLLTSYLCLDIAGTLLQLLDRKAELFAYARRELSALLHDNIFQVLKLFRTVNELPSVLLAERGT